MRRSTFPKFLIASFSARAAALPLLQTRFRARVCYDGIGFHGVQKNRHPLDGTELRTVLSTLEQSLWPALDQQVKFRMASRTDAGVSASGQVMTFDITSAVQEAEPLVRVNGTAVGVSELADALNSVLPPELKISEVVAVPRRFDVVRDCKWKRYRYRLPSCEPGADDEEGSRVLKVVASHAARAERQRLAQAAEAAQDEAAPLTDRQRRRQRDRDRRRQRETRDAAPLAITDVEAMARAAALLEGTHDFGAFQASRGDQKSTVRTIFRCALEPRAMGDGVAGDGTSADGIGREQAYDIVIEGDGFLYKMVRLIAGTLVTVGMGLAPPEAVLSALSSTGSFCPTPSASSSGMSGPRRQRGVIGVGPTLPPERLCLEHIEYDEAHARSHSPINP